MSRVVWLLDRVPGGIAGTLDRDRWIVKVARPVINALVPRGPVEVIVRSGAAAGLRMQIDSRHEKFYWSGTHERHVQDAIATFLQPGSTLWDVGAHVGFHTLAAARAVGPGGRVIAFEPVPENRARLLHNIHLNGFENVVVVPEALSATAGDATMFSRGQSLMWTLDESAPGTTAETLSIHTSTIDEAALRLSAPDLLKIDVEGAELDILGGGRELLDTGGPAVLVELMNPSALSQLRELLPRYEAAALGDNHYLLTPEASGEREVRD